MPKIDLNQQLATIPPYINTHSIIKGDSKSVEKLENFQKEYRDFQLKKLQKTLLKEIDLFKRRKKNYSLIFGTDFTATVYLLLIFYAS